MRSYLDFEKPVAELEAKIEELRAIQASGDVAVGEEIERLEAKAAQVLRDLYANLTLPEAASLQRTRTPCRATAACRSGSHKRLQV